MHRLDILSQTKLKNKQIVFSIQNQFAACGGDDYEICFTAPSRQRNAIEQLSSSLNLRLTRIGQIVAMKNTEVNVALFSADGKSLSDADTKVLMKSFDHFAS